jgi:hypothetical protein
MNHYPYLAGESSTASAVLTVPMNGYNRSRPDALVHDKLHGTMFRGMIHDLILPEYCSKFHDLRAVICPGG